QWHPHLAGNPPPPARPGSRSRPGHRRCRTRLPTRTPLRPNAHRRRRPRRLGPASRRRRPPPRRSARRARPTSRLPPAFRLSLPRFPEPMNPTLLPATCAAALALMAGAAATHWVSVRQTIDLVGALHASPPPPT